MPLGTFLNGGTAVQLRGLAWLALSDTGIVSRGTFASDSGGGGSSTWANAGGTVACRVDPIAGDEQIIASRLSDRSTHVITVPAGTDVTHSDRFVMTAGTFEVTAVRSRTDEWARFLEAVQVS